MPSRGNSVVSPRSGSESNLAREAKAGGYGKARKGNFLKAKLTQHLKYRPSIEDLQDRNIVEDAGSPGGSGSRASGKHTFVPDMPPQTSSLTWDDLYDSVGMQKGGDKPNTAKADCGAQLVTTVNDSNDSKAIKYLQEIGGDYPRPELTSTLVI